MKYKIYYYFYIYTNGVGNRHLTNCNSPFFDTARQVVQFLYFDLHTWNSHYKAQIKLMKAG